VRTLRTYVRLPWARQPSDVQRMFQPMLQLGSSAQERTRSAVAAYLETAVQPLLLLCCTAAVGSKAGRS